MRNLRKGFTLLELIVVIVVMGVLAAIAIPTFAGVISKSHISAAKQTADAFVTEAKTIYSFNNDGAVGIDSTATTAALADLPAGITGTDVGGVTTFSVSGKTVAVTDTTGAYTVS